MNFVGGRFARARQSVGDEEAEVSERYSDVYLAVEASLSCPRRFSLSTDQTRLFLTSWSASVVVGVFARSWYLLGWRFWQVNYGIQGWVATLQPTFT